MTPSAEPVTFPAKDQSVQPWQAQPYKLWSLLDMLIFSAQAFLFGARALRTIRGDCMIGCVIAIDNKPAFAPGQDMDSKAREKALRLLPDVEEMFRKIGLSITADTVQDVIAALKTEQRRSFDWLVTQADNIEELSNKELKNRLFIYVPPEHAVYWPKMTEPNFGNAVADAFPNSARDVAAAGRCLALNEGTACVSHLMRALESPLQAFAKRVGVTFPAPTDLENWKNIVDQMASKIEAEVKRLEGTAKAHERNAELKLLGDIALDFRHFKNAWRNGVAHGRDWYDEPEAQRVYDAVKHFMQKMAEAV